MLEDAQLHYVDTVQDAQDFIVWIDTQKHRAVAVDTETTGLKWWTPRFVRLVQFGTGTEAWALDTERWRGAVEQGLQLLVAAHTPIIFHNCSFDMHALESDGYPAPHWSNVHDTMFVHHLLFPHESHSLKTIAASLFGNEAYAGQSNLKSLMKRTGTDWATVDTRGPDYWAYGCMDTILTHRVAAKLMPEIRTYGFVNLYDKAIARREIMQRSETRGLRVDLEWANDLRNQWTIEAVHLADQLEAAGIENPRSNSQVTTALNQLDWEPDEFTPSGAAKLDKVILNQLSDLRPEWADVAVPLLRYRRLTKWISAYLDPFIEDVDSNGYLHHSIRTLRAVTGRDSITEPAMQTLPARDDGAWMIRRCIIPDDGHVFYAVDYSSQEPRCFAHYSQDPGLLAALREGKDLYTHIAQVVYNDPTITKSSPLRDTTKVVLLAFTYGAGVAGLSQASGLSMAETVAFIHRMFELFPGIRKLTGDHVVGGQDKGQPAEAAAMRYRTEGLRYIKTKGGRRFSVGNDDELYKCVNGLMQGSGSDILSDAILRLDIAGYGDNIVLPIHDELIFQFPEGDEGEAAARECAAIMVDNSLSIPITTELSGPFKSWGHHYMPEGVDV